MFRIDMLRDRRVKLWPRQLAAVAGDAAADDDCR